MNNEQEKIYLGNAREKERRSGDKFLVGSICVDDIEGLSTEHVQTAKNGKRYVRILINPYMAGMNEYGNTHSIRVDTWQPDQQHQGQQDQNSPELPIEEQ